MTQHIGLRIHLKVCKVPIEKDYPRNPKGCPIPSHFRATVYELVRALNRNASKEEFKEILKKRNGECEKEKCKWLQEDKSVD